MVAVGTTTVRVLESLYWIGVSLLAPPPPPPGEDSRGAYHRANPSAPYQAGFGVEQWEPYAQARRWGGWGALPSPEEALAALAAHADARGLDAVEGSTSLMIVPG